MFTVQLQNVPPQFGHSAVAFGLDCRCFKILILFGGRRHFIGDEESETTIVLLSKQQLSLSESNRFRQVVFSRR